MKAELWWASIKSDTRDIIRVSTNTERLMIDRRNEPDNVVIELVSVVLDGGAMAKEGKHER